MSRCKLQRICCIPQRCIYLLINGSGAIWPTCYYHPTCLIHRAKERETVGLWTAGLGAAGLWIAGLGLLGCKNVWKLLFCIFSVCWPFMEYIANLHWTCVFDFWVETIPAVTMRGTCYSRSNRFSWQPVRVQLQSFKAVSIHGTCAN